ncbi:MAG: hypothetical protein QNJ30_16630 [Kiloniellales bacterium]|nr:hypothetical protein [Kiloniellales bacterium]
MVETLLSPTNVLLYGRELQELKIDQAKLPDLRKPAAKSSQQEGCMGSDPPPPPPPQPPRLGDNNFLEAQLRAEGARLARIYAFSYEGHYYDLARPALFLVHGPGSDPEAPRPSPDLPYSRLDRAPADADRTGVASQDRSFSDDMRVWSYDKGDHSIRLDPDAGTFEEILLECELRTDGLKGHFSGKMARATGSQGKPWSD